MLFNLAVIKSFQTITTLLEISSKVHDSKSCNSSSRLCMVCGKVSFAL
jgi:hypothetical protein